MILVFPKIILTLSIIFPLAQAAREQWPKHLKSAEQAIDNATLAITMSTPDLPPELLLAIARVETGFRPHRLSWKDGRTGKRLTGNWISVERERWFMSPYFCGILQAKSLTWHDCLELRRGSIGVGRGVAELTRWVGYCKADVRCVLAGHGGGWKAVRRVEREAKQKWRQDWKRHKLRKPPYWWRVLDERDQLAKRLAAPAEVW